MQRTGWLPKQHRRSPPINPPPKRSAISPHVDSRGPRAISRGLSPPRVTKGLRRHGYTRRHWRPGPKRAARHGHLSSVRGRPLIQAKNRALQSHPDRIGGRRPKVGRRRRLELPRGLGVMLAGPALPSKQWFRLSLRLPYGSPISVKRPSELRDPDPLRSIKRR